jgi:hypothetical protein
MHRAEDMLRSTLIPSNPKQSQAVPSSPLGPTPRGWRMVIGCSASILLLAARLSLVQMSGPSWRGGRPKDAVMHDRRRVSGTRIWRRRRSSRSRSRSRSIDRARRMRMEDDRWHE